MVNAVSNAQGSAANPYFNIGNVQGNQDNQPVGVYGPLTDELQSVIDSIAGGATSGVSSKLANPEKVNNLYDLKRAVEAGQIKEIKAWDKRNTTEAKNNKTFIVIKFKTTDGKSGKIEEAFIEESSVIELKQLCIQKGVKFNTPEFNPALDNLSQALIQASPGVAVSLIGILGFLGMRKYSLWKFEQRVKQNLITRPTEILDPKNVIGRNYLQDSLVGMPEGVYGRWDGMWEYIDEAKSGKDKVNLDDRRLSVVLAGMPGCGKSVFNLNALYHTLNELNGQGSRPKVVAVRIDNLEKEQSKIEEIFGFGARDQKAEIISKVLSQQGADIGVLYSDDPKDPRGMLKLFKGVYDMTDQSSKAGSGGQTKSNGMFGRLREFLGFGGVDSSNLKSVHLHMTTNNPLPSSDFDDQALARRVNYPERIMSLTSEQRITQLRHFIAQAYSINPNDVPDELLVALADKTKGQEDEKAAHTFVPETYKGGLMKTLLRVCPSTNPAENVARLSTLASIVSGDEAILKNPANKAIFDKVYSFIVSVTGENVPKADDIQAAVRYQMQSMLGSIFP